MREVKLKPKVWIAEDDNMLAGILGEMMGKLGYETRVFKDPYKLTEALKNAPMLERPDVMVTDYTFSPTVSPMMALRGDDIKTESPHGGAAILETAGMMNPRIPVVVFSGKEPKDLGASRYGSDVTFIVKPKVDELKKVLKEKLSSKMAM